MILSGTAILIGTFTPQYYFAEYSTGTMVWQRIPLALIPMIISTAAVMLWLIWFYFYRRHSDGLAWLAMAAVTPRSRPAGQGMMVLSGEDERTGKGEAIRPPTMKHSVADDQQRLVDRQIVTYKVLRAIGGSLEPDTVAYTAVETVAELTGWPTVVVATPDPHTQNLVIRAAVGVPAIDQGVMGRAFRTGHTQTVPDDLISASDYSALVIPLRHGRQRLGVFVVESDQPWSFSADDRLLAESLAEVIVLALDNARLYTEKHQQVLEIDRLLRSTVAERSRLQALIESDRDGIVMVSTEGYILVVNEPALALFHLNGGTDTWVQRPLLDAVRQLRQRAPQVAQTILAEMRRMRQGDESPGEGEIELSPYTINWRNLPVTAGDTPSGRLLVLRDVTEERLLDRMRDDLIHTMVHDLRGPLSSISISLHLLEAYSQSLEPNGRLALDRARLSMGRVLELVNAILDVSRLESGRMTLSYEPVSPAALVGNAVDLHLPLASARQIRLTANVPASLPLVWTDPTLTGRVLQNLVGNAVKFTPDGGHVWVTAAIYPTDPTRLLIAVRDTGYGIPADIQGRLFQKFTTGDQLEKGSGLGLYFCKMVLEAHGEQIWVEDTSAKGTTFCFTLPLSQSQVSDPPANWSR